MDWNLLFKYENRPSMEEIKGFVGKAEPIWEDLTCYIEANYGVKAHIEYSKCSGQPGWNVKYKKGAKALCTLYPMPDSLIALVVIGTKEENAVAQAVHSGMLTPYVKDLYQRTTFSAMGKWLMIQVDDDEIARDVKTLMAIRVAVKDKSCSSFKKEESR